MYREAMKLSWPAPERNKGPILEVLERVLPESCRVLEIASGSGQHAVHFAEHLPHVQWYPTDVEPAHLASIAAYVEEAGLPNLHMPRSLDVREGDFGQAEPDAVFVANLVHIAPWDCTEALVRGAAHQLAEGGALILYGPFRVGGRHTSESNAAFDAELRQRDPSYGVRDVEAIVSLAETAGLRFVERVPMPANNQILIFERPRVSSGD